ncbi:MAG: hypothetical protein IJ744_09255 [Lachnospiraceae bacterium]|nr:hypothetical protein [Lachnospiraceae bacterium]
MFPLWNEMMDATIELVKQEPLEESVLHQILTVMAIDNETEDVLDYLTDHASDLFVSKLIEVGVKHEQPGARWQCAELIRRRKPCGGVNC